MIIIPPGVTTSSKFLLDVITMTICQIMLLRAEYVYFKATSRLVFVLPRTKRRVFEINIIVYMQYFKTIMNFQWNILQSQQVLYRAHISDIYEHTPNISSMKVIILVINLEDYVTHMWWTRSPRPADWN